MKGIYKVLYLEDEDAASIVSDLKSCGLDVHTVDVSDRNAVFEELENGDYQAFLMDYRLSSGRGNDDAPVYTGAIRTQVADGKKSINAPIVLITEEKQLNLVKMRQEDQDQYDYVMLKEDFSKNIKWSAELIKSFVDAYDLINSNKDNIAQIFNITSGEKEFLIDYRLEAEYLKLKEDTYASCHFLLNYFVRSCGSLVKKEVIAARLGVDIKKSGDSWTKLLDNLCKEGCLYTGIMSNAFNMWWMEKVASWWKKIIPEQPTFRYESAEQRIELLNKYTGLNLVCATPIEEDMSHEYWTVCVATGKALDPSDGYICNRRFKREWEENDYISLKGALEVPELQVFLSKVDRRDIVQYGQGAGSNK